MPILAKQASTGLAQRYLFDQIQLVADLNRSHLRSLLSMQLVIRRTQLTTVLIYNYWRWSRFSGGQMPHLEQSAIQCHLSFNADKFLEMP